jgi:hypothetical protein
MSLTEFHGFQDSIRWRLVPEGVELEGSGLERTRGEPLTVTRIWEQYSTHINRTARERRVPCALIIATIATESGGNAQAIRLEPGYVADEVTPQKISVGLMQTLIRTAREAIQMNVNRGWLLEPGNAIEAGTAYISQQARKTLLDPPLVACAYNAGGLYHQTGRENRWKLRQYPIGTGKHADRFIRFFNDACFVLSRHSIRPTVTHEQCLRTDQEPPRTGPGSAPSLDAAVQVRFAQNARAGDVTPYSRQVLEDILRAARLKDALISSTSRSPAEQARVMFENLERYGVEHQKQLYGRGGDRIIDVYARSKRAGKDSTRIKTDMEQAIIEQGPTNVSRHASDPRVLNVFDVAPSSIKDRVAFERAVKSDQRVSKFLVPPGDPGYHLEIPQPAHRE